MIQPRLAERWENKDNLLWTFHLRPGLTWSDGTAITAQDIVWSWQRLVSPATASLRELPWQYAYRQRREIAPRAKGTRDVGVKALNDTTLQVTPDPAECRLPGDAGAPFAGTDRQSAGGAVCR